MLTTLLAGVKVFLAGQATFNELVAFFIVIIYAHYPLTYTVVMMATKLAIQHTVWLAHQLILNFL